MTNTPNHLPTGKPVPLPVLWRPWSHLGVDFVTDLTTSERFTCILAAVNRFSKACYLVPLKGLPTAMKTAEVLCNHVFRSYGITEDMVSGGGHILWKTWELTNTSKYDNTKSTPSPSMGSPMS